MVVKGLSTGAKALIGVERLAILSAKISEFANALKQGILKIVKVGKKIPKASDLARAWQGNDVYTGIDKWRDIALKKGQKVVGGLPGQSEYYTTLNGFNRSKGITDDLWNGLQVKPHPKFLNLRML